MQSWKPTLPRMNEIEWMPSKLRTITCTIAVRKDKARELLSRAMPSDPGFFKFIYFHHAARRILVPWLGFLCLFNLAVLGLSWGMWAFSCSVQNLVHWPGIESGPRALGAWSPKHWTAREFPRPWIFKYLFSLLLCLAWFLNLDNADAQTKRGLVSCAKSHSRKMRAWDRIAGTLGARLMCFHLSDLSF